MGNRMILFQVENPTFLDVFLFLAAGHFLADYPLQTDKIAIEKCPGKDLTLSWKWWLTAHAGTHAFFVGLVTGQPLLLASEWLLHFVIDFSKCKRMFNLTVDQCLHLFCKLVWAYLAVYKLQ